jgi:hypothetical protein
MGNNYLLLRTSVGNIDASFSVRMPTCEQHETFTVRMPTCEQHETFTVRMPTCEQT